MVNTPKRHPSGRRKKPEKTIDLEANIEKLEASADSVKAADSTSDAANSKPDAKKAETVETGATATTAAIAEKNEQPAGVKPENREAGKTAPSKTNETRQTKPASGVSVTEKSKGGSLVAMIVSGVLGGAVTLGGAGILNATGNLQSVPVIGGLFSGPGGSGEIEAANMKIADLEARLDALSSGSGGNDLSGAIAELSGKINAVETRLAGTAEGASAEVLQTAEEALAAAQAAAQKADATSAQITELNERIVESSGGASVDMEALKAALSSDSEALVQRLDGLEARLGEIAGNSETATELAAIRQDLSGLAGVAGNVDALGARTDELAGSLEDARQSVTALGERLGALETSVNDKILPSMGEVEKAASAAIESQKVARSVSARALGNVLEQGGRFTSELAAAEALSGGSEAITELKPLAENGISTNDELVASFQAVSDAILTAEAASAQSDGILDKFMASARTLVQVRPSGPVSGDSTTAILSRIEAALNAKDLQAARAEWDGLDDAAKAASAQWVDALDDRIKAKTLIESVIADLSAEQAGGQE